MNVGIRYFKSFIKLFNEDIFEESKLFESIYICFFVFFSCSYKWYAGLKTQFWCQRPEKNVSVNISLVYVLLHKEVTKI